MARNSFAGRAVFAKLAKGKGGFKVRYPKLGKHAEFDWSRQVLVLARGATPQIVIPASSGKSSTPTVFGSFRFQRREPGTNSHGMYYSTYFIGGYAIHGYPSVPTYPASHGCIRIPIPSAQRVYSWIELGDPIKVYR
jgi:lipoprotein-anchoring transpeptidase ErfK/SrfK